MVYKPEGRLLNWCGGTVHVISVTQTSEAGMSNANIKASLGSILRLVLKGKEVYSMLNFN